MMEEELELTEKEKADKAERLNYFRNIYARREGNYPEVKTALEFFYGQIKAEYDVNRSDNEKKYRHHIRVFVLDLFVANQVDPAMYITYSRNKNDYAKGKLYHRMHLRHAVTTNVIEYLETSGYIEHHKGFHDRKTGYGRLSRIRATEKLSHFLAEEYKIEIGMYIWDWDDSLPTVILRDENKQDIPYEDTEFTLQMEKNIRIINRSLEDNAVFLYLPNKGYRELFTRMQKDSGKGVADFTRKGVKRVFNNSSFKQGGRFYEGWWQNIPREYRHLIRLNDKDVVECDYSGLHINMLYADMKLPMPPGDVYHIPDPEYPDPPDEDLPDDSYEKRQYKIFRDFVKQLLLTIVNCDNKDKKKAREETRKAMQDAVLHKKTLKLPKEIPSTKAEDIFSLMDAFARKHDHISTYFCSGAGIDLQYLDSQMAEQVLLHFSNMRYPILPMHDSFIIHHGLEQELKDAMNTAFKAMFDVDIKVDLKYNSIRERQKQDGSNDPDYLPEPCDLSLPELLEIESEDGEYGIYHKLLNQFRKYKQNQDNKS